LLFCRRIGFETHLLQVQHHLNHIFGYTFDGAEFVINSLNFNRGNGVSFYLHWKDTPLPLLKFRELITNSAPSKV